MLILGTRSASPTWMLSCAHRRRSVLLTLGTQLFPFPAPLMVKKLEQGFIAGVMCQSQRISGLPTGSSIMRTQLGLRTAQAEDERRLDWKTLLAYFTGAVDQELLLRNQYLVTENRILRNQIKGRTRLSGSEREELTDDPAWGSITPRCAEGVSGAFSFRAESSGQGQCAPLLCGEPRAST
jgi:hypothetical protein